MFLFDKKITKVIFASLNIFITIEATPVFSKLKMVKNLSNTSYLENSIQIINNDTFKNIFIKDNINLDYLIYSLIANDNESIIDNDFYIDIESEKQFRENDIYHAEGNVIIKLKNGVLKTDKFYYDRNTSDVELKGNISFIKGEQNFTATMIKYNFKLQEGFINNVSGSLNLEKLEDDLSLYDLDKDSCPEEELDLLNLPEELELLNSKNSRLNNILGVNLDFGKISNWKFESEKISIKPNLWQSDYIRFTNDPYEKPQFFVESRSFNAEILDETYKFTSKSTHINFENKLRIPVGNRTISDADVSLKWGIGYDMDKKDGLFIYRTSKIFKLTKDLEFSYKPYFLVQRAIRGKTSSFRLKNASFLDEKKEQNTSFSDFIAIESDIKGSILNYDSNINIDLGSLNGNRSNDSLSIKANFLKTLYSKSNQLSKNKCSFNENFPVHKFSIKSGIYAVYLKDNIYSAYGKKLLTDYSYKNQNLFDNYALIFDFGTYKSKSLRNRQFLNLDRYGINATFKRKYKLTDFNQQNLIYDSTYKNTPVIINKALFLNTKLSTSVYQYSNKKSQRVFSGGIGPSFIIGNLKRNILDYTSFSLMPQFIDKKGESPFIFDNLSSESKINFNLKQQIFGPILFGFSTDYIINKDSNDYKKFTNNKYSLDISRRAYKVSLFYKNNQSFGLNFNIFNF